MMSPQVAASLLIVLGLSMVAGWATVFRNRYYLGSLGIAFLALAGALLAGNKVKLARTFGSSEPGLAALGRVLLILAAVFGALALVAAVQETRRRLAEIQESHRAAEEALVEMIRASREKEAAAKPSTGPATKQNETAPETEERQ
jgi:hypothetical protein